MPRKMALAAVAAQKCYKNLCSEFCELGQQFISPRSAEPLLSGRVAVSPMGCAKMEDQPGPWVRDPQVRVRLRDGTYKHPISCGRMADDLNSPRQGKRLASHPLKPWMQFSLPSLHFINLVMRSVFPLVNYFCYDHTFFGSRWYMQNP